MSIIDKCLICGEKIADHGEFLHGVACLGKLHDLIIDYAEFQKMLQDLGMHKYPIPKKVTKKLPSTTATNYETIPKKAKKK